MVNKTGVKDTEKYRGNIELEKLNERLAIDKTKLKRNTNGDPTGKPVQMRPMEEERYRADIGETDDTHKPLSTKVSKSNKGERESTTGTESAKSRQADSRRRSESHDFEGAFETRENSDGSQTNGFPGEIIPAVQPQDPEKIGEAYGEAVAGALGEMQLTQGAKDLLEMGLSGGVSIDTNAIFNELRDLVNSPVQGLLEAQRVGTLNKLYFAAEKTVDSLIEHLYVSSPATRVMFLKTLLSEIRKLQELGGLQLPGGVRLPAGVAGQGGQLSVTRETMTIDLAKRTGKLQADKVLGHEGTRPQDDFLKAGT